MVLSFELNVCVFCMYDFRTNIEKFHEIERAEWNASALIWDPKAVDPPYVNLMKRAEVTSASGKPSDF